MKKESPITYHREFYSDHCGSVKLTTGGGTYCDKTEAIEYSLQKLELSPEERARATKELSEGEVCRNYCNEEGCYGSCYKCKGKYGRPREYWERRVVVRETISTKDVMNTWMDFLDKLKDLQETYLQFVDTISEDKRETLEPFTMFNGLSLGLASVVTIPAPG